MGMKGVNMNNQLGKEIIRIRKSEKITQKQLCEGICTQPTISMIEKGEVIPGVDILASIAMKLNVPITYFTEMLLTDDLKYKKQLINELEELTINQQFEKVYRITSLELQNKVIDKWFEAFLKWQYYLSCYYLKKIPIESTISNIKNLIHSIPNHILNKDFLSARIYNTIAFLYATKKEYSVAMFYYNKINLKIFKESPRLNVNIYQLRILYNKTKTLYDMEKYEDAVNNAKQGIKISIQQENMSIIGNFYYYIGQCYEKLEESPDIIKEVYQKALFFFELLERTLYVDIIKQEKSIFLKN